MKSIVFTFLFSFIYFSSYACDDTGSVEIISPVITLNGDFLLDFQVCFGQGGSIDGFTISLQEDIKILEANTPSISIASATAYPAISPDSLSLIYEYSGGSAPSNMFAEPGNGQPCRTLFFTVESDPSNMEISIEGLNDYYPGSCASSNIIFTDTIPPLEIEYLTCGDTFTDSGGENGDYMDDEKRHYIICPQKPNIPVSLVFSEFDLETGFDDLIVFDSDNFENQIGSYTGIDIDSVITATNSTGCLSVIFNSDFSIVNPGWIAQVLPEICDGAGGFIYNDINADCIKDNDEIGIANRLGIIQPGNIIVQTNHNGAWSLSNLPAGIYTLTVDDSGPWESTCPPSQTFEVIHPDSVTIAPSLGLISTEPCSEPEVSIHMPFMRPCFTDQKIYVQACNANTATGVLIDAYVQIELDPLLIVTNSSLPYTDLGNQMYQFDLGTLNPGMCENFYISTTLDCSAVLSQTLCMEAEMFPQEMCVFDTIPTPPNPNVEPCLLPWDKSSLSVEGYCQNDSIYFEITNTGEFGEGDMLCWSPVTIYIDGEFFEFDSIQLVGGETITYVFEGTGQTWHLQTEQHPLHPGNSHPNATVELCGDANNWTPDLVNIFPQDDADPVVDIFCGVVTGSYDPNDKTGFPLGVTDQHFVLPNQQMEYLIRFQNTGTDTAFTVVVRDTLEEDFDIFSIQSGASSHPYTFQIYGERILEWTFNDILLPDSTTNEVASHGFVVFHVDQLPDLPNGTELNNNVGIYFDYNAPVITNTTSHIVDDGIQNVTTPIISVLEEKRKFEVFPNPTSGEIQIVLDRMYQEVEIEITNVTGQLLLDSQFQNQQKMSLELDGSSGIYFIQIKTEDGISELFKIMKKE